MNNISVENIAERIMDIHTVLDIDELHAQFYGYGEGKEIEHTAIEQLILYKQLVERIHNMLIQLYDGIVDGMLPPLLWDESEEMNPDDPRYPYVEEIEFTDHCKEKHLGS